MLTPKKRGAKIAKWLADQQKRKEEALIAEAIRHAAAPNPFGAFETPLPVAPRGGEVGNPQLIPANRRYAFGAAVQSGSNASLGLGRDGSQGDSGGGAPCNGPRTSAERAIAASSDFKNAIAEAWRDSNPDSENPNEVSFTGEVYYLGRVPKMIVGNYVIGEPGAKVHYPIWPRYREDKYVIGFHTHPFGESGPTPDRDLKALTKHAPGVTGVVIAGVNKACWYGPVLY